MVLDLESVLAPDVDDGATDGDRWFVGGKVYVGPPDSKGLADPDAGGQHDVDDVEDVFFVEPVLASCWLLP